METETEPRTPPQRLLRRRADRRIAGVAAGVADHFRVDPTLIRVLFAASVFAGGVGVVIYLLLWLLMPVTDEPATYTPRGSRELARVFGSSWAGTLVIAAGALVIGTQLFSRRPGLFWGLALIVIGLLLFRERDEDPVYSVAPSPQPSGPVSVDDTPVPPAPGSARAPRPRRARSPLGLLTIGLAFVVVGLMWWADVAGVIDVRLGQYFAVALLVIGVGVLVGTWWGRARSLIAPGLMLVPMVLVTNVVTVPFEGGHGTVEARPTSIAALRSEYRHATGSFELDLRAIPPRSLEERIPVIVTNAIGTTDVMIPAELAVDLRARVGWGSVNEYRVISDGGIGRPGSSGVDLDVQRRFGPREYPAIQLDVQMSLGTINIWEWASETSST